MTEFIQRLTWVDYLAVIAVLRGCYVGYRSGIFPELLRITSYLITAVVTVAFQPELADFFTLNTFLNAATAGIAAFVVLAALAFLTCKLISLMLLRVFKVAPGGFVMQLGGMLLGAGRWIIVLSLLFMAIAHSPLGTLRTDIETRSLVGPEISRIAPALFDFLNTLSPGLTALKEEVVKP